MSMNLDRSLDEILDTKKGGRGGRRGNRAAAAAPAGGVRKRSTRSQRNTSTNAAVAAVANATVAPVPAKGKAEQNDTKILVSLLPHDVSESQIKDYFAKTIGKITKCQLVYGPNGSSRGMATLEFAKAGDANLAFQKYNGIVVDKKPIKVELIVDPSKVPFSQRVHAPRAVPAAASAPAAKPKAVTSDKGGKKGQSGRGGGASRGDRNSTRGRGAGKKSRKTADELDAEMADYFNTGSENTGADANAAAPAPATTA